MTETGQHDSAQQRPHGHRRTRNSWIPPRLRRFAAPGGLALLLAILLVAVVPGNTSASDVGTSNASVGGAATYGFYLTAGPGSQSQNTDPTAEKTDHALLVISGIANGFDSHADVNPILVNAKGATISWDDGSSIRVHLYGDDTYPAWQLFDLLYLDSAPAQPHLVNVQHFNQYSEYGLHMAFVYCPYPAYGSSLHTMTIVARTTYSDQVVVITIRAHKVSVDMALKMVQQVIPYTGM